MPTHRIRTKPASTGGSTPPGACTFNQYAMFFQRTGPTSYDSTNGLVIDLTATYSSLNALRMAIKKGTRGSLGIGRYEVVLNSPVAGKATVSFFKHRYERVTATGNVVGQPAGVTVQAASGVASSSEAAHVHTYDHTHVPFASGAPSNSGAAITLDALGPNMSTHTHTVTLPAFNASSLAGSSHNHTDNTIYQHQHTPVDTSTQVTLTEIANATNLSASTLLFMASGVRA